jgi:hypothetical protein
MPEPGYFATDAFQQPGAASAFVVCNGRAAPATRPVTAAAKRILFNISYLRSGFWEIAVAIEAMVQRLRALDGSAKRRRRRSFEIRFFWGTRVTLSVAGCDEKGTRKASPASPFELAKNSSGLGGLLHGPIVRPAGFPEGMPLFPGGKMMRFGGLPAAMASEGWAGAHGNRGGG